MDAINFLIDGLIKKGRKPRGIYKSLIVGMEMVRCEEFVGSPKNEWKSMRELTSKESGLRQFVCENNLVDYDIESGRGEFSYNSDYINGFYGKKIFESNYKYRIIESAMKDETDLETFLLENIKI